MIAITVCILILLYVLTWCKEKWRVFQLGAKFQKPPGFSCHPILGHAKHLQNPTESFKIKKSFTSPHGVLYVGPNVLFFLNDPALAKQLLKNDSCVNKPDFFDYFGPLGESLFLARNENYFKHRKIMHPNFSHKMMKYYINCSGHREQLVDDFREHVGSEIDVVPVLKRFICIQTFECMLGIDGAKWYNKIIPALVAYHVEFYKNISKLIPMPTLRKYTTLHRTSEYAFQCAFEMLEDRRLIKAQNEGDLDESMLVLSDYLIQCLDSGILTKRECLSELLFFIFAATDTAQVTIANLLVCLGIYPDIQDKVYQEIVDVLGDKPFEPSDYTKLEYLGMVFKETLRMCLVAGDTLRLAHEDIKIGDYVFPKGSNIVLNFISIHYNPKYYNNPSEFIPERFAPDSDEQKARPNYAYLPFSAGIRACPGKEYARWNIFATVIALLRKYRFESRFKKVSDIPILHNFLVSFENGYDLKIHKRLAD